MKKLTVKQQKFVAAFVESANATQSAIEAGYSKRTARVIGQENLLKPAIKSAIDKRLKEIDSAKIMSSKEIMERLSLIARGEATEEVIVTFKDGYDKTKKTGDLGTQVRAMQELSKRYDAAGQNVNAETDWAEMVREAEKEEADDNA